MGINAQQLKDLVVIPVLKLMELDSGSAIDLVMGTAAQESHMGKYIRQVGFDDSKNGAFGIYQIELLTHDDVFYRFLKERKSRIYSLCERLKIEALTDSQNLTANLFYSTAICRAKYLMISAPLPEENDLIGLAKYWKKYYNTDLGRGTMDEFIDNFKYWCKK